MSSGTDMPPEERAERRTAHEREAIANVRRAGEEWLRHLDGRTTPPERYEWELRRALLALRTGR